MPDRVAVDAVAEGVDARAPAPGCERAQQQHGRRRGFDAAGRRAGAAADQHQHVRQQVAGFRQLRHVDRVEAGRARRHGKKERRQCLSSGTQPSQRRVTFEEQEQQPAAADQDARDGQNQPRVQLQFGKAEAAVHQIAPDHKAQTADHDQRRDRQRDERVARVGRQRRERRPRAHQVEARVAERRDRVKQREIDPAPPAEFRNEADAQQRRARQLKGERKRHDVPDQRADAGEGDASCRLHQHLAVVKPQLFAQREGDERDHGHEAEAAELDQQQDHDLPEGRPAGEGVPDDQSGHAGRARRGEQRVEKARAVRRGDRQRQQSCSDQNDREKAQRDQPRRGETYFFHKSILVDPAARRTAVPPG